MYSLLVSKCNISERLSAYFFVRLRIVDVRRLHEKLVCFLTLLRITLPTQGPTSPHKQSFSVHRTIEYYQSMPLFEPFKSKKLICGHVVGNT